MKTRIDKKSNNKKKKRRKVLLFTLPILILLISGVAYGGYLFWKAADVAANSKEELKRGHTSEKRDYAVDPNSDSVSMLIMGIDDNQTRNYGDVTRTDTLILSTFNIKEKSVKMVSIPRDSYVYIPAENQKDKITHAHVFGGTEGTIEAVEELFDIPVDYFVKLNFKAFVEVIDALNGIEVNVPYAFVETDSTDKKHVHLEPGFQKLNGEQALALARTRKLDSDIERGKRQLEIIKAIVAKAASANSITKYDNVIESVGDNMTTNLSFKQMIGFVEYATAGNTLKIETMSLEGSDLYLPNKKGTEIYYYKLDEENLANVQTSLKTHLDLSNPIVLDETSEPTTYNNTSH